ncbi:peptidase M20 domain-containing protein 2 [Nephila pilipes]|uniref:Peptidase M20 domain-containing protein 2 n=1 Tax=Nephila pilipes TaxID=299642 RepID=A0A8X6UMF5_NEPPI|nr:peptidase M20 domain-containing protein 2 [Nephila pilipes]
MSHLVGKVIQENESLLKDICHKIWSNPELAFQETYSHDLLTASLKKFGFEVQKNYILPTAFRAEFCNRKDGPTIAILCEYDALPDIGHACGHNLIAEISLAAGIAVKTLMERDLSICGKVVVLGTPAEESGGGKIILIENGAFTDIDAALMAHPQLTNMLFPLILDLARVTVIYKIKDGLDPWENPNANDAAVACYNNISMIRGSFDRRWRVSGVIKRSTWEETEMNISYRAPTLGEILTIKKKLKACFESAAEITGCECEYNFEEDSQSVYRGMIANKKMAQVFAKHAETKGIVFQDDNPRICESAVSTDMGNVSHVVPSIQPEYSIGACAPHVNHTPGFATAAGSPAAQEPSLKIAECLALTVLDLMTNPELMIKVKSEFETNPNRAHAIPSRQAGE